MADYNSVPQGQAGTGAAFLLGGSRALQNWIGQDKQNRAVDQANSSAQALYDQNIGKSYSNNAFKGVNGQMWNAELQSKIDEHLKQGAKYRAQGIDVYNPNFRDPAQVQAHNTYMQDRSVLNSMLAAQKAFQADEALGAKALAANGEYAYTPESLQSRNGFEKSTTLYDAVKNGSKYPELERVFDYNKNVKSQIPEISNETQQLQRNPATGYNEMVTIKEPRKNEIEIYAKNLMSTGQNRNYVEKQIGGSLDGLLYTTDKDAIKKSLDNEFRSPNGIELIAELKNKGKVPSFDSPEYSKFLDDAVKEQLKAETKYDSIISKVYQDGIAKVDTSYKAVPNFSLENEKRAKRDQQIQEERLRMEREKMAHKRKEWTQKEIDAAPDGIAANVVTNTATTQSGGKVVQRPSTSLSTTNVGNAKTPFLPQTVFDSENGLAVQNSSPILVSGGQVHIKPVLYFKGGQKVLDDESLKQIKDGTYKLKIGGREQKISPDADIRYDELLYGTETTPADPKVEGSKSSTKKVIIPITGQSLDKKFDKAYNRQGMYENAIRASKNFETKKSIIKQQLKLEAPNMSDSEIDRLAFETAKQY